MSARVKGRFLGAMKLTCWLWLVALGSTGIANATISIGCDGDANVGVGLGGDDCEDAATALNKLDGVSGVKCGGYYPFLYLDQEDQVQGSCRQILPALNSLVNASSKIFCDDGYNFLAVTDCAVATKLSAILQGPTCKHGNPVPGPAGGGNCTGPCDQGWQGSSCDSPGYYVCNSSTGRCVLGPGSVNISSCLKTCTKPPPPPPPPPCHTAADCGPHQTCDTADGSCQCASGWTGAACGVCDTPCGPRGSCVSTGPYAGDCLCDSGYDGTNCSTLTNKSPLFPETQIVIPEWGTLLNNWAKQPVDQKWALCYSSDTMSKTPDEFHKRCDQYNKTVSLAHNSLGRTFGGFADQSWWSIPPSSSAPYPNRGCRLEPKDPDRCYKGTSGCFIFELGWPAQFSLKFGPVGWGTDYLLADPKRWPSWGFSRSPDLSMGSLGPPGTNGSCGTRASGDGTYAGVPSPPGQPVPPPLCGNPGMGTWGETQLEVWRQV